MQRCITQMRKVDIVEEARTWIGVRWQHQGRTRHGIDCAGLIVKVAHKFELSDFDVSNYPRSPKGYDFLKYFDEHMDRMKIDDYTPGHVVVLRDSIYPCHVAIIADRYGEPSIIHSHAVYGAVREEEFSKEWQDKRLRIYSYKGVDA